MYVAVHKSLLTNATLAFANSPLFQLMIPPPHTDFFGDFLYGATHRKLWSTVHLFIMFQFETSAVVRTVR